MKISVKWLLVLLTAVCGSFTAVRAEVIDSQVDDYSTEVEYTSPLSGRCKMMRKITIFNKNGDDDGHLVIVCDKFNSLGSFSGTITNAAGKVIKKISKQDLKMVRWSESLSDDTYMYVWESYAPQYPYTVEYMWEMKVNNESITFPRFCPIGSFNQSVKHASYSITVPQSMGLRWHQRNVNDAVKSVNVGKNVVASIEMNNLNAIPAEPFSPNIDDMVPMVLFAPTQFSYDGFAGNMASWQEFGKWLYGLFAGREAVPESLAAKVKALTANCTTDHQKVERLYEFLKDNTRYVSMQLGIGGYQPMPVADVMSTGFGDCKALSFFMRALLHQVGIESDYAVISTSHANVLHDFANVSQFNHAVLRVPFAADTLWLECTNASLPMGFVHKRIAGHEALLVKPDGGELVRVPAYDASCHVDSVWCDVQINADFSAQMQFRRKDMLDGYALAEELGEEAADKQNVAARAMLKLKNSTISNVQCTVDRSAVPSGVVSFTATVPVYGKRTGSRLFAVLNPLETEYSPYSLATRHNKLATGSAKTVYCFTVHLAEGLAIEGSPDGEVNVDTDFGSVKERFALSDDGRTVTFMQEIALKAGVFEPTRNADFKAFRQAITDCFTRKLVIKNQ